MTFDRSSLDSYNDVASRLVEFRQKFPDGSLQPVDPAEPFRIVDVAGKPFLVYAAAAYRSPDDTRPGIGVAWEPLPGRTPYTKDSEVMVAETSAWGRAILAVGAADARKGVASQEEVASRLSTARAPRRSTLTAEDDGYAAELAKRKKRMFALYREVPVSEPDASAEQVRLDRLADISKILGHTVGSSDELSLDDVNAVIAVLEKRQRDRRQEAGNG